MVTEGTAPATALLKSVVIAAHDPVAIATFWADAVSSCDSRAARRPAGSAEIAPDGTSFTLVVAPTGVAKAGQNRIHFDLTTSSAADRDQLVADLVARGASDVDVGQSPDEDHVVLADPEGNELCVLAPGNRFLAGCPRLGAVNCDGTAELGYFWSAVLGWPLVWNQDEETAIQAPDRTGPKITWSGTPLMPRSGPERLHFHVAPVVDLETAVEALTDLGAQTDPADQVDQTVRLMQCEGAVAMIDPDGNPFCIVD